MQNPEKEDNDEMKWHRYHFNPYHNPTKIWRICMVYEGEILQGEIIDYGWCSATVMMLSPANDLRMRGERSFQIWGEEGQILVKLLLIDLYHAYRNIHANLDVIRDRYEELLPEYEDYKRKIEEANDFGEREALDFEKRTLFKQVFKPIIGYCVENLDSFLIVNKLV